MLFKMMVRARKILLPAILAVSYCVAEDSSSVKIVGGNNATITQYPYQVALMTEFGFNCGGVIISEKWILTAAHCISYLRNVHAGSTYYNNGSTHEIVKTVLHRRFTYIQNFPINDIALVQVYPEFAYSDKIRPAKLPRQYEEVNEHSSVVITGWGRLTFNGTPSDILQSVEVDVISNKRCKIVFPPTPILPNMFCTMMELGGKGSCLGDSGGPVSTQDGVVIGIVSGGRCDRVTVPAIHTKVSHFRDWISEVTGV